MMTSQRGSPSSATLEKNKINEDEPLHHLLHLRKKRKRDDNELRGSSSSAFEGKTKRLALSLHFSTTHFVCTKSVYALVSLWYYLLSHN
jgi:hypothetical protein